MKEKKYNNKDLNLIINDIYGLLGYEKSIKIKKDLKIELTEKEKIFDTFIVSPSLIYKILLNNDKKGSKRI